MSSQTTAGDTPEKGRGASRLTPAERHRWLTLAAYALIALIAVVLYGAGLARGEAAARNARAETQQVRNTLATTEAQTRLLAARGWLYRATLDLEQRNFGTANGGVAEAAKTLNAVDAATAGVDAGELGAIRQSLATVNLEVAPDVGASRTRLAGLADRLTAILPAQMAQVNVK